MCKGPVATHAEIWCGTDSNSDLLGIQEHLDHPTTDAWFNLTFYSVMKLKMKVGKDFTQNKFRMKIGVLPKINLEWEKL